MKFQQVLLDRLIEPAPLERARNRDLPILSMTMHEGLIDQASKFKKRVASADTAEYKVVRRNQLVVGFPIDEGVLSFQDLYDEAIVSPAYDTWRLRGECKIEAAYLERFLRSPRALSFYRVKLRGTTARRRTLPDDIFLSLIVPLPPLAEQRRIVEILDRADTLRAKRRAALAQLDALTQSIFLEMFGDPVANSKGWNNSKLGELVSEMQYGPRFYNEAYASDGIRIARITDLTDGGELNFETMPRMHLSDHDVARFALSPGDVIFARSGATAGKVALFGASDPPCIPGAYFIRMRFKDVVVPEYAKALLSAKSIRNVVETQSRQSAQQNFSGPGLRRLPMPLPPIDLQWQFVRREKDIGRQKVAQRRAAGGLDALFASIQHRAFRGEL